MPDPSPGVRAPVFVVGPPRSGTTLVRVALNRHPDLHIVSETHLYDLWADRFPGLRQGRRDAFEAYWKAFTATDGFVWLGLPADDVPARLAAWGRWDLTAVMAAVLDVARTAQGVARVGEKTPDHARHLDELLTGFPDARIVYVVRDPRATVASELRLQANWASDDPTVAAERWAHGVAPLASARADPRVHVVRYEQLVATPVPVLHDLCEHLGLAFVDGLAAGGSGHPAYVHGDQDPWAAIDPGSVDAWREQLDPRTLALIDPIVAAGAAQLGYPSPREEVALGPRLAAAPRRWRRRVRQVRRHRWSPS